MQSVHVKLGQNGRVVIPAEYRRVLGVKEGEEMVMVLDDQSIRLMTVQASVAHAREVFKKLRGKPGQSVVDEFIAERRAEAKREKARS